ncbi:MAG: hypothetical protein ACREBU_01960 [Nitrososphaera sp.]
MKLLHTPVNMMERAGESLLLLSPSVCEFLYGDVDRLGQQDYRSVVNCRQGGEPQEQWEKEDAAAGALPGGFSTSLYFDLARSYP